MVGPALGILWRPEAPPLLTIGRHKGMTYRDVEKRQTTQREYYAKNRVRESRRRGKARKQWRRDHLDRARLQEAAWKKRNPASRDAQGSRYRAAKRNVLVGDAAAIKAVYRRARDTEKVNCYLCGKRIPLGRRHVDHIVPLSKGGAHAARNLAITHAKCNLGKGAKLPCDVGVLL
jgi:5-methylcytosine-specific restriction endonuclease McrA